MPKENSSSTEKIYSGGQNMPVLDRRQNMSAKLKDDFERLVEECRKKKIRKTIYNASREHAAVLIRNLIQVAAEDPKKIKEIKIVSGDLDSDFYGALTDDIVDVLGKGCKVSLVVLNPGANLSNNEFFMAVDDNGNGKAVQNNNRNITYPHFIVVGKEQYRLEKDHEQAKAVANFNDPDMGEILYECFDDLINKVANEEAHDGTAQM